MTTGEAAKAHMTAVINATLNESGVTTHIGILHEQGHKEPWICGADGWDDIEYYGECKLDMLREYLPYAHGAPSDDTLRRFFRALDPQAFGSAFVRWAADADMALQDKVIAIDGKTSRRSFGNDRRALHMVSAFASEACIVLGQVKTEEKSNEITAIPELLDLLAIQGAIISIDAMGCQKDIAAKIIGQRRRLRAGGSRAIKKRSARTRSCSLNDKALTKHLPVYEETDGGHGRIEIRRCIATDDIGWLKEHHDWPGLRSIVQITSTRMCNGETTTENRYYITSMPPDARKIAVAIRSHWAIENSLH